MKTFHTVQAPAGEGESGGEKVDRGDVVTLRDQPAPISDEEKKIADDIKAKATVDASKTAKAAADDEEDDPDNPGQRRKRVDSRIPLARHKEILDAQRVEKEKLLAKLEQYERGSDLAETNEKIVKAEDALLKLEKTYTTLVSEGKIDEATKVMSDIRATERFIGDTRGELRSQAAEARAYERARYDTTVERVEAAYPELNPDNGDDADEDNPNKGKFNPVVAKKILSIARAYQGDGLTPSKALQEAVKDLLGEPKSLKQKQATEVKPQVDEAAAKKAAREEEARRKATEAAGKQPARLDAAAGKDSDQLGGSLGAADVMKMTFEDFSKLDQATLSRMRGDELAA